MLNERPKTKRSNSKPIIHCSTSSFGFTYFIHRRVPYPIFKIFPSEYKKMILLDNYLEPKRRKKLKNQQDQ